MPVSGLTPAAAPTAGNPKGTAMACVGIEGPVGLGKPLVDRAAAAAAAAAVAVLGAKGTKLGVTAADARYGDLPLMFPFPPPEGAMAGEPGRELGGDDDAVSGADNAARCSGA